MRLYCNDKILKKVPAGSKREVLGLLETVAGLLQDEDRHDVLKRFNDKTMRASENVRKFNGPEGSRFIWMQGKHLNGARPEEDSDVFLIAYTSHDRQGIEAGTVSKDINRQNYYRIRPAGVRELEEVKKTVRLTNPQHSLARGVLPAFISGGAGNGKTLVAIHRLANINMAYPDGRTTYITLTENLRDTAAVIYRNVENAVIFDDFQTVHGLFSSLLSTDRKGISYHRFKNWYTYEYEGDEEFPAIDIWTEIRGTIKGYAGDSWERNILFDMTLIDEKTRNFLLRKKEIVYCSDDKKTLIPRNYDREYFNRLITKADQSDEKPSDKAIYLRDIDKLRKNHKSKKHAVPMLSLYEYVNMDSDISRFTESEKTRIYDTAVDYQEWLEREGYHDDNDLALMILSKDYGSTYDFMVLDEVQDLPEIQIKALVSLLKEPENIVMSGDVHQVLQPNSFNPARLTRLYKRPVNENYLSVNHRSQGQIVDFTNELSDLRRSFIGSRKIESEQREEAVWRSFSPFLLDASEDNIQNALQDISRNAGAAIVVADEEERRKTENLLGLGFSRANTYTVEEVKGLEFEYVFCLNLIGSHISHWKEIFDGNARHSGRHRYYFNTLYVAATRARESLCFCEEGNLYGIGKLQELFKGTHRLDIYSPASVGLPESFSSDEDWNEAAWKLEGTGGYEKASMYYMNAGNEKAANRCSILHELESDMIDSDEAAARLLDIGENRLAQTYAERAGNIRLGITGFLRRGDISGADLERRFGDRELKNFYLDEGMQKGDRDILEEIYIIPAIAETEDILKDMTGSIREFTDE